MSADIDAIIGQMEWAAKQGLSELTVTLGDLRVQLRRTGAPAEQRVLALQGPDADAGRHDAGQNNTGQNTASQTLDAPMAGICHLCDAPGSAPFVSVGDTISLGQTVCILEAMKVMTSVTATYAGTVSAVLVEDGASVTAQMPLFELRA